MNAIDEREMMRAALERRNGCPPLATLIDAAFAAAPTPEQESHLAHAASCASCAAELELASAFDGSARTGDEEGEIAWVEGRVDVAVGRAAEPAPLARVLPMRKKSSAPTSAPAWTRWAAAALVVLGLAVALRWNAVRLAPPLPDGPSIDVVRSGELLLESPIGELPAAPERFEWRPVPGATNYSVEVRDVAGDLLFSADAPGPALALTPEHGAQIESHVSYTWTVIARDAAGAELARSAPAIFRFRR